MSLSLGMMFLPLQHAKYPAASSGGIYSNIVNLSFSCSRRAVFLFENDIGVPESAKAYMASFLVFNFLMWPLRSSSVKLAEFYTSDVGITESLFNWNSSHPSVDVNSATATGSFFCHFVVIFHFFLLFVVPILQIVDVRR